MMDSFLNLNTIIRIFLISIALIIIILSIISIILTDSTTGYYEHLLCHHQFVLAVHEYVKGYHTFTKRYLRCPKCKRQIYVEENSSKKGRRSFFAFLRHGLSMIHYKRNV